MFILLITFFVTGILMCFRFSDLYDRKWPLIFPAIGMVLASIVYILMSLYDSLPVGCIVLASFLSGAFGGFVSCIMAVMSYVSAVSSEESRGMRVAMLEAMTFCGGTVGPFIGGAVLTATDSHAAVFTLILGLYVMVVIYVLFCVPSIKVLFLYPPSANSPRMVSWYLFCVCGSAASTGDDLFSAFKRAFSPVPCSSAYK